MKKGKFEAKGRGPQLVAQTARKRRRLPRWLLVAVLTLLLAFGGLQIYWLLTPAPADAASGGLTKEETVAQFQSLAELLEKQDMNLVLYPDDSSSHDVPIVLTLTPAQSRVRVDLTGLEKDLEDGVGKVARGRYVVNPEDYISLDRLALRELAEQTEQEWARPYLPSFSGLSSHLEGDRTYEELTVNVGMAGREISADEIYETLIRSYYAGELSPTMTYQTYMPEALDVQAICARYRTEPVDAELDLKTFEITPEVSGLGVDKAELERTLDYALPGKGYTIPLRPITPDVTAAKLETYLYGHILAEAHTPHSRINDRTNNLILACAEIDGTILMPGDVFSFNEVVGERTKARGYKEATAYVGGASVPEIGGGVCQVASSIYYATLQADLPTVERHSHTYLVTYVPQGMDAAIYWKQLDFKFENSSPYPIKIEASVADGEVHIYLRGREWKDYHVDLSFEILDETPWETVEQYVYDDSYATGETIVAPYTGYRIATYKKIYDANGDLLDTEQIAVSRYAKRDKVVAVRRYVQPPTDPSGND